MAELEEATLLQLEALKKEGKTRALLEKFCCLIRFHYEENRSPTRERNLKKFSQLANKARKRLILILYIKGTTTIPKQSSVEPTVNEIGEEEKEESSDFRLIPSYFFEETDDSDTDLSFQFFEVAKAVVTDFVHKNFVKLSEESLKKVLLTLTHILLMGNCSSSIMNSSRCLFDRGKYKLKFGSKLRAPYCMGFQLLDRLYREIVQKLVYYPSNGFSGDSFDCMLTNEDFITTACYMFGKMLECEVMRRLFDRGKQLVAINRLYFVTHLTQITSICGNSSSAKYTRLVFDRGREFDESIVLDKYTDDLVSQLNSAHEYYLKLWSANSSAFWCVVSPKSDSGGTLFDYSRVFVLLEGFTYFVKEPYKFCFHMNTSYIHMLKLGLILLDKHNTGFVQELIIKNGYHLALLFGISNVEEFVKSGDRHVASNLIEETHQLDKVLCRLHVIKECGFCNAGESILQIHPNCGWNSRDDNFFLKLQMRCVFLRMLQLRYECKLLTRRRQKGKILWTVFILQIAKEAAYGKPRELLDHLHNAGRWYGSSDIGSFIFHLMCRLLNNLVTHSGIQGTGKLQQFSNKIAYYVAGNSSEISVWKIPLEELRYLQVFLLSIPTVVKSHVYLSDIMFLNVFLLTSASYESLSISCDVFLLTSDSYGKDIMNTSCPSRYLVPCYSSLRGWVYKATERYSWIRFLASSKECGCDEWSFRWNANHAQLLKNYSSVKKERKREQCMCYFFCEVFNPIAEDGQPHTFSISTILYHGFCQVHPSTSAPYLSKPWSDDHVCFSDYLCWLDWLVSDLLVWISANDCVATTACHVFPTGQHTSFLHYVISVRPTYIPAGKLFSHKLLMVLIADWIRLHDCSLVLILTTVRSCFWFLWRDFFIYNQISLSVLLYGSLTVPAAVMKFKLCERITRIRLMLTIMDIPVVFFLMFCSKWESKLFPWSLGGVGNVSWISVTSLGVHFYIGKIDSERLTLAKDDNVIVLQRRKGQDDDAQTFQAVLPPIRYGNCMYISTTRIASLLYSAPGASGYNDKEEEKDISAHALAEMRKHDYLGYVEVSLSSVHVLATIVEDIVSLPEKLATQLDSVLVLTHITQLKNTCSIFDDQSGQTGDSQRSSRVDFNAVHSCAFGFLIREGNVKMIAAVQLFYLWM